jgi:hypothetical protein
MMTLEAPIACSLAARDYVERLRWIAALNSRSLRRCEQTGLTLRLVYDMAARADVERLAAQERACCAFLDFEVTEGPQGLVLAITAPERARAAAEAMFGAFTAAQAPAQARASGWC